VVISTWAELVAGLDEALAFARTLKLDTSGTRFSSHRDRINGLDRTRELSGDAAALEQFLGAIELNAVALTESQELATIVPFLASVPPETAAKKLSVVLKGPELPADEDTASNEARNTMFELNLAARLYRAGLAVDLSGAAADLRFTCDGVLWFGECKRPYRIETIENNIGEGCRQLGERLVASRLTARGLLAISVSRPLTTKAPYIEYPGEVELRRALKERVGSMVRLMEESTERQERCRRVSKLGLLVGHIIMPAWSPVTRIPTGVQYSAAIDLCRDRSGDGERVARALDRTYTR
jgi:hypothetical protein